MKGKVIGLCGGSGSGKGTVGKIFSENDYLVIDTDKVYRDLTDKTSKCLDALVSEFGNVILNSEGGLDRRKLASIVFSDKDKHSRLNEITHKFVLEKVSEIINSAKKCGYKGYVVDAPMLYESGFDKECDYVVAVICDIETRIARIIARDGIPRDAAIKRINAQIPDSELVQRVDFVIDNSLDEASLKSQVYEIIDKVI